jgi:hypothetical protein
MGAEAFCKAVIKGRSTSGTLRLEAETLQFRSRGATLSVPFKRMKRVVARGGTLTIALPSGAAAFELGPVAATWVEKILHPPSRLTKIGVKSDWRASAIGRLDPDFLAELRAGVALLAVGRLAAKSDAIFFAAVREADLERIGRLKRSLKPNGALWIVRQKGHPEITEARVMLAGRAAGLVDVKVIAFSPTHTAEKFVIPVKDRSLSGS